MKRPSFQFYPADWRSNAKLRRCSDAARGAWVDVLCLLHDADEYGVLRWPLVDIAQASGVKIKLLRELSEKGVLKGADKGAEPYVWAPTHAGRKGDPVELVEPGAGPCWYCSRFVRDEYIRQRRGANSRFGDENPPPKAAPKPSPKGGFGEHEGYGASSASSSKSITPESSKQAPKISEGASAPAQTSVEPTERGRACLLMRQAGCALTNPSHPDLIAALAEGVTPEALGHAATEAVEGCKARPFAWAISVARSRHAEGAKPSPTGATHGPHRTGPRLSAVERVEANIRAARERDQQQPGADDDAIPGEALRIAR